MSYRAVPGSMRAAIVSRLARLSALLDHDNYSRGPAACNGRIWGRRGRTEPYVPGTRRKLNAQVC